MNIRDITIFQTVAKTKSISKASHILYMTPQGISKVIKNLELECESEFFLRKPTGLELTKSGLCFARYAADFAGKYKEMQNDLLHIRQQEAGVIDLLSAYGILRHVTPECIISFRNKYPNIEFHYREYPDRQVERLFQQQEGNIAFSIADFDENIYNVIELARFPVKLLVNRAHGLAGRSSVTILDLKDQPLYIENSEFKIYHLIVNQCRAAGFEPNIVFETSGFSLCHKMVSENKGISVTVDFISDDMRKDNLIRLPFSDGTYEWKMCMITRKNDIISPAIQIFQNHIIQWVDAIRSGSIIRDGAAAQT